MRDIVGGALLLMAIIASGYMAVKNRDTAMREEGARSVSEQVERAKTDALAQAREIYRRTTLELETERRARETESMSYEAELKRLRDELAKNGDADGVVFGGEWSRWLSGGERPAAVTGR